MSFSNLINETAEGQTQQFLTAWSVLWTDKQAYIDTNNYSLLTSQLYCGQTHRIESLFCRVCPEAMICVISNPVSGY